MAENVSAALDAVNATVEALADGDQTNVYIAYSALFVMALVPIYVGSWLSLSKKQEAMSQNDAATFPLYASGALLGLYLIFKVTWRVGGG